MLEERAKIKYSVQKFGLKFNYLDIIYNNTDLRQHKNLLFIDVIPLPPWLIGSDQLHVVDWLHDCLTGCVLMVLKYH